jgi:hypothetical protein
MDALMRKPNNSTHLAAFLFVDPRWHEPHDAVQCRAYGSTFEFLFKFETEFSRIFCSSFKLFENQTFRLSRVHCIYVRMCFSKMCLILGHYEFKMHHVTLITLSISLSILHSAIHLYFGGSSHTTEPRSRRWCESVEGEAVRIWPGKRTCRHVCRTV